MNKSSIKICDLYLGSSNSIKNRSLIVVGLNVCVFCLCPAGDDVISLETCRVLIGASSVSLNMLVLHIETSRTKGQYMSSREEVLPDLCILHVFQ